MTQRTDMPRRIKLCRQALERSSTRPADLSAALWLDFQAQAQAVRELEAEWRLPDQTPGRRSFSQLSADLDRARHTLRQTVTAVRAEVPNFLPRPTFDQILAAAQPGPLIYLLATEAGGLALIVHGASTASPVEALWLDTLHSAGIDAILYDREDESQGRYLRGAVGADPVALADSLAQALPLLGERLAQPLAARLAAICPAGTPVTLIASSTLGLLPLHAAPVTLAGRTAPFMDFFAVRYAPSATVLHQATRRADQAAALRVAGVGNPLSSLETDRWAQGQVATLLPALQAIDATRHLAPLPGDDPAAAAQRAVLLARWQRTLVRLAAMATMEASDLVRTGRLYVDLLSLLPLFDEEEWLRTVDNAALAAYLDRHQELMAAPAGEENRMSWLLIRDERRRVRNAIEQGNRQDRPYQAPYHWAAFAYFGADLDPIA